MNDREGTSGDTVSGASHDLEVRAGMVIGLVAYAMARGLSRQHILDAIGLSNRDLLDPDARVPALALHRLWKMLAEHCPGENVALQLAAVAPASDFGVLLHAVRHTDTLRAGLQIFVGYSQVLAEDLDVSLLEGRAETTLRIWHPLDEVDGGHAAEMAMAFSARFARELGDPGSLRRVEFRHAPHGPVAQYEAFFDASAHFGMAHNALVFRTDMLDNRSRLGDRTTLGYLQNHLDLARERLAGRSTADPLSRVRAAIARNAERRDYSADALASYLGTSLRTLQRQLRAHEVTVGALLEEAREANARQLLSDRRLSVDQVAFLVGYSSARAFRRACLRWTGKTPGELRPSVG